MCLRNVSLLYRFPFPLVALEFIHQITAFIASEWSLPLNAVTDGNSIAQEFSDPRESHTLVSSCIINKMSRKTRVARKARDFATRALKEGDENAIIYDIETGADVTQYFRGFYYKR